MLALVRTALRRKAAAATAVVLVFLVAGTTIAGSGIGGVFNLGRTNIVNYLTTLTGSYASRLLQVTNTSTSAAAVGAQIKASYGTPLQLVGSSAKPPFTTNSGIKVTNLNADRLDNLDSTQLMRAKRVRVSSPAPGTTPTTSSSETEWFTTTVTQPAGQAVAGFAGEATVTVPSTCTSGSAVDLFVYLDNELVLSGTEFFATSSANLTKTLRLQLWAGARTFVAPDVATARQVKVTFREGCNPETWTFQSLKLDFMFIG
jgi:hypothetical protein